MLTIGQHVMRRGSEAVVLTPRLLRYWWRRLNGELFRGQLWPCHLTHGVSEHQNVYGLCYGLVNGAVAIHIDQQVSTRLLLVTTLAHEMIHQKQHQTDRPMHHDAYFGKWVHIIKQATGLDV